MSKITPKLPKLCVNSLILFSCSPQSRMSKEMEIKTYRCQNFCVKNVTKFPLDNIFCIV